MRREIERVIARPARQDFVDRTLSDLAGILAGAGQLGAAAVKAKAQQLRIDAAARQAEERIDLAQRELGIRAEGQQLDQERQRFALDQQTRETEARIELGQLQNDDQSFRRLEKIQTEGLPAIINNLTPEQLRSAIAGEWGVIAPGAIQRFDELAGRRRAQDDLATLERLIAESPGEDPVTVARGYTESLEFPSLRHRAAYLDSLDGYLASKATAFASRDVAESKQRQLETASRDIQFAVMSRFSWLTRADIEGISSGVLGDLQSVDPRATEEDAAAFLVESIKPLFIGPEARFTAREAIDKLEHLFPEDERNNLAAQGMIARLQEEIAREDAQAASGMRSELKRRIEGSETLSELQETLAFVNGLEDAGQIQDYDANIFRSQLREQFAAVRADEEVLRGAQGVPVAAYTGDHHAAIDRLSDEMGLTGPERAAFQVETYGLVTDATLERISANALSADVPGLPTEERLARLTAAVTSYEGIARSSPTYARQLIAEGQLPRKLSVIASLATLTGQNPDLLVAQHAGIPDSAYARADAVLEDGRDREGDAIRALRDKTLFELTRRLDKNLTVSDATVQRIYLNAVSANMALQLQAEGEQDPKVMFEAANEYALRLLRQNVRDVKIGSERYAFFQDEVARYGWGNKGVLENVNTLWTRHRRGIREDYPGLDEIRLNPSGRRVVVDQVEENGRTVSKRFLEIPVVVDSEFVPTDFGGFAFRVPLDFVDLKIEAEGTAAEAQRESKERYRRRLELTGGGAAP